MRWVVTALIVAFAGGAAAQGAPKVVVGDNPSLSGAPLYIALEKGYYRAAGIDVQLEMSGTSSEMAVLLAALPLQPLGDCGRHFLLGFRHRAGRLDQAR